MTVGGKQPKSPPSDKSVPHPVQWAWYSQSSIPIATNSTYALRCLRVLVVMSGQKTTLARGKKGEWMGGRAASYRAPHIHSTHCPGKGGRPKNMASEGCSKMNVWDPMPEAQDRRRHVIMCTGSWTRSAPPDTLAVVISVGQPTCRNLIPGVILVFSQELGPQN